MLNKTSKAKVTLLGTGTSQGVPVIGCDCPVCTSTDPRDKRLRTAALLSIGGKQIAIDCGPDFRAQMLSAGLRQLDAILITHQHNDHIIGLDDVRPFNFRNGTDMPVYCTVEVGEELRQRFAYVFASQNRYPGAPQVQLHRICKDEPFEVAGLPFTPIEVMHGQLPVLGFRYADFAYLTDVRTISESERRKLKGIDTLVLSALHHRPHHAHLTLEQALAMIEELGPKRAFLVHASHRMGLQAEVNAALPDGVQLGWDGLSFEV